MSAPATQSAIDWGNVAQWVAAFVMSLVALVALFKEEIMKRWRRPILDLSLRVTPPDCYKTELRNLRPGPGDNVQISGFGKWHVANCYYFRLWVDNHGKTRAERVQVFATRLHRLGADGKFVEDKHFLPLNLRWSHSEDNHEVFAEGISPHMGKHCDLGRIIDPEKRADFADIEGFAKEKCLFELAVEFPSATRSHLLQPGVYRLELKIAAGNVAPIDKTVELSVTGNWFDEEEVMFRDGIGLRLVA
ncbi:MAG TPA: hypothetical protein VGJ66_23430 [Pyrinomonadaceae bacterium]